MTVRPDGDAFTHTAKDEGELALVGDPPACPTCRAFDTLRDGVVVRHHDPDCPAFLALPQLSKRPPGV